MAIVDYAYPCMMAEKALRKVHDAILENKYEQALELALVAIAETRLMYQSIRHMKEKQSAREASTSVAVPNLQGQAVRPPKASAQITVRPTKR